VHADNRSTSLGTDAAPIEHHFVGDDLRSVALFFLKTRRELEVFLDTISGGTWPGIADLSYHYSAPPRGVPYSWPVGEVHMADGYYRKRYVVMHETGHQVMWKAANYTTWSIALSAIQIHEGLYLRHGPEVLANEEHALIEGWAWYVAWLFTQDSPYLLGSLYDESGTPTALDWSANLGESSEGAFANALWQITRDLVIPPPPIPAGSAIIPEAWDGDVKATAQWINDPGAQQRWQSMIYEPLTDLSTISSKTTSAFVNRMRIRNPADWHRILKRLQDWNIQVEPVPVITSVSPSTGQLAGGDRITIGGTNFPAGCTVGLGGNAATNIDVRSSTEIRADTPAGAAAGPVDVTVKTNPALTTLNRIGRRTGGFTYA
jgi:hypothetical protein